MRMPTLAIAYFGMEGLPPTLQEVPLEIIEEAIKWLNSREDVLKDRIGIIGASRGGELAILSASLFPEIKAVVGYTPSGVVWEGIGQGSKPAWTYKGKPFPYLRFIANEEFQKAFEEAQQKGTPFYNAPFFKYSMQQQQDLIPEAIIKAENSKASFLLIGNPDDGVWPSDDLSILLIDRLRAKNYKQRFELLSYKDGGHMLIPYPYYPTTMRKFYLPTVGVWEGLGGTAEGAARAAEDSWDKVIQFLKRELAK